MGRVVDVEINAAKALITLGSMYRNAADAIKEYVSNALDEWAKVRQEEGAGGQCKVRFTLTKNSITIDYNAPGMDEAGFEDALKHVVDSRKEGLDIPQIGRLGIGLWAFNQVGDRATFYSKRSPDTPTIKVVLTRNSSEAEFFDPDPGEEREIPGMTIEITGLFQDPTRRYGPVSQARLKHVLADRFDVYLRTGQLKITIRCGKVESEVEPIKLDLPEIGIKFRDLSLATDRSKVFSTRFWFDPSGNGRVSIRHTGVVVIDDLGKVRSAVTVKNVEVPLIHHGKTKIDHLFFRNGIHLQFAQRPFDAKHRRPTHLQVNVGRVMLDRQPENLVDFDLLAGLEGRFCPFRDCRHNVLSLC